VADVQLVPADVRASASRIADAGEVVRAATYPERVVDVGAALPGSVSAAPSERVRGRWSSQTTAWSRAAADQAGRMSAAVADTEANDAAVSTTMQRLTTRLGVAPR
jgi:hypothetical protein